MASAVSDEEIAREVRTLRNLRRRSGSSTGPGALPLDPDLPPPSPASDPSIPSYSSNDDITLSSPDGLDGDAAGLFWVPAHLHPELAPGEFRAFLKAHTHSDPEHAEDPDAAPMGSGVSRSPSFLNRAGSRREGGLGRKRSMLSKQYQPRAGDEEDAPPVPTRQPGSLYRGQSAEKGLTLSDLQKLEEMVEEAGETDNPEQMRNLLRRSLSTNVAPGFLHDDVAQGEGVDTPPPRPGSILRRSARTKIRKAGLQGDGGGHRFAATRKGRMTAAPVIDIPGLEDDDNRLKLGSDESEDHREGSYDSNEDESETYHEAPQHIEEITRRPSDSSTDETHIFDAYARNSRSSSISGDSSFSASPSPEGSPPSLRVELPGLPRSTSDWFKDGEKTPTQETMTDPLRTYQPSEGVVDAQSAGYAPKGLNLNVPTTPSGSLSSPVSPTSPVTPKASLQELPPGMAPPAQRAVVPPGIAHQQQVQQQSQPQPLPQHTKESISPPTLPLSRTSSAQSSVSTASSVTSKEKEKKGGFFSKKDKDKDKDKEKKKKDKDRFLGSLFGSSKKKVEEPPSVSSFSSAGPAAAAALLGSSKSAKSIGQAPGASPTSPAFNSFARYPIHVERAVYRLSHIKLANARRPLYEQVLISNLMFWYLGVIGRNVAEEKKEAEGEKKVEKEKEPKAKGTPPKPLDVGSAGQPLPREEVERLRDRDRERGEREKERERERERERDREREKEKERQLERERAEAVPQKKIGLTKPDRARQTGRDAEAPVRSPSYGMQHNQVDSEIRTAQQGMKGPRVNPSAPPSGPFGLPPVYHPPPGHSQVGLPGGQPPYAHVQPQQQQPRAGSSPPPGQRALTSSAQGSRPISEYGPASTLSANGLHDPRDPRNAHDRSPSPGYTGPTVNGHAPAMDPRGGEPRQRTYSSSVPAPQRGETFPPPGNAPGMRRVVSEARSPPPFEQPAQHRDPREQQRSPPPQMHPPHNGSHVGPQPGQIFHHPSASPSFRSSSPGLQPGQILPQRTSQSPVYGHQPGQIFRPPPGAGPGMPGQVMLGPGRPQANWEGPQRLPPGASATGHAAHPGHPGHVHQPHSQNLDHVPPHLRRPQSGGPGFERNFSDQAYQGQPLPAGMSHSQSLGGHPRPPGPAGTQGGPAPGQGQGPVPLAPGMFSPYAVPPPSQGRGGEDYRRVQPVQQGTGYHHR